jgi:hypothetical protein
MDNFKKEMLYCRICGLKYEEPPWGVDGKTPSFEICECCGVEFGYEDITVTAVKKYRKKWISSGAQWFNRKFKPGDWDLQRQLASVPETYREGLVCHTNTTTPTRIEKYELKK